MIIFLIYYNTIIQYNAKVITDGLGKCYCLFYIFENRNFNI